jgi:hypothetical protein
VRPALGLSASDPCRTNWIKYLQIKQNIPVN